MTKDRQFDSVINGSAPRPSAWRYRMAFIGASVLCFVGVVISMWDCPSVGTLCWLVLDLLQNQFPMEYLHPQHANDVIAIELLLYVFVWCDQLFYFAVRKTPPAVRWKYTLVLGFMYMLFQFICKVIDFSILGMIRNGVIGRP